MRKIWNGLGRMAAGICRPRISAAAVMSAALLFGGGAHAASYPERPIHIVVQYAAGGPTDVLARIVADAMTEVLGQQVVIENRPGASGQIAVDYATQAKPDGYTLLLTALGTVTLPVTNEGFDAAKLNQLVPISKLEQRSIVFVGAPGVKAKDLGELLQYAKAHPGEVTYGAQGSVDIAAIGQLASMSGTEIKTVRYRGGAPAVQALLGDHKAVHHRQPGPGEALYRCRTAFRTRRQRLRSHGGVSGRSQCRRYRSGLHLHGMDGADCAGRDTAGSHRYPVVGTAKGPRIPGPDRTFRGSRHGADAFDGRGIRRLLQFGGRPVGESRQGDQLQGPVTGAPRRRSDRAGRRAGPHSSGRCRECGWRANGTWAKK